MKLFISADIEGCTGTTLSEETHKSEACYRAFADRMTEEVKNDKTIGSWLGSQQCTILPIDEEIQLNVRKIVTECPKMISFAGGQGSSSGDAFLIATAMKYNLTIITEENKEKHYKIPWVCKKYGIQTVNITELCVTEGWAF